MANPKFGRNSDAVSVYGISGSWSSNVKSWVDHAKTPALTVRYEDMRDQPELAFARIAEHMMMRPSPDQLQKAIALATRKKAVANAPADAPADAGGAWGTVTTDDRWGSDLPKEEKGSPLSAQQVRRIVDEHGKLMQRFGYPT